MINHPNRSRPERPPVFEPEDCIYPQGALGGSPFILVRKAPNGDESWDGKEPPARATYSIALVYWKDEARLAVRFDGDEDHPNGVPSSNSWPSWFIMPRPLQALLMPAIPMQYHAMVLNALSGTVEEQIGPQQRITVAVG